jgi:hypothetical protein
VFRESIRALLGHNGRGAAPAASDLGPLEAAARACGPSTTARTAAAEPGATWPRAATSSRTAICGPGAAQGSESRPDRGGRAPSAARKAQGRSGRGPSSVLANPELAISGLA